MDRKVIFAGKIEPGISKGQNCLEIINQINELKLKKEMKEILFLAVLRIIPAYKKNKDILFHLDAFWKKGKVYPEFSSSEYVQNVINEVKKLDEKDFKRYVEKLIEFVAINNIEFKFEEK